MTKKNIICFALLFVYLSYLGISKDEFTQKILKKPQNSLNEERFIESLDQFTLTTEASWQKIQPQKNSFDWTTSDVISQLAKTSQRPFKWLLDITSSHYPTWINDLKSTLKVEENLLKFVRAICERYENLDSLVLLSISSDEVTKLLHELGESCKDENLMVHLENSDQVRQVSKKNSLSEIAKTFKSSRLLQASVVTVNINYILSGYTLSVSSLSSTTNDATLTNFEWNWQDGAPVDTTESATHIYKYAGTYTVILKVTDSLGSTGSATLTLTVPITTDLPKASFTASPTKQVVFFNGGASNSKLGQVMEYKWDFGDNIIQTSNDPTITHTYPSSNRYNVTLTVTDDHNAKGSTMILVKVATNIAPSSDFSVQGIIGHTVTVQQNSKDSDGYIANYQWSWGDGTSNDTIAVPTHVYTADGTYDIILTVVDDNGAISSQKKVSVQVPNNSPIALFTTTSQRLNITFDATGSISPTGSILDFKWNFGDSSPLENAASPVISHTYISGGGYTVTLTVTNSFGLTDAYTLRVKAAANLLPVASFTYTITEHTLTVTSNSSDSDGTISEYRWNFGDSQVNGTNASTTSHTYAVSGTYNVTLTVVDNDTQPSKPLTRQILINDPPVAAFTFNNSNFTTVSVDASTSTDDNRVNSYTWDWGDSTKSSGVTNIHNYAVEGTYTITLTVTDGQKLSSTASQSVDVIARNTPPVADFTVATTLSTVDVDGSRSKDNKGVVTYTWNWGDSSPVQSGTTARHTYAAKGFYKITLTVTDVDGLTNSTSKSVSVTGPISAPVAGFTVKMSGLTVYVDGSTSTDSNGVSSYNWSWGDSTSNSSGRTTQHTYSTAGSYDITLTVSNSYSLTNTITKSVTVAVVNAAPKAAFTYSISGTTVQVDGSRSSDDVGVASYSWNWGDATALSTGVKTSHTYTTKTTFPITLTVTDAQGLSSSMTNKVTIR